MRFSIIGYNDDSHHHFIDLTGSVAISPERFKALALKLTNSILEVEAKEAKLARAKAALPTPEKGYDLVLYRPGDRKISCIKQVRSISNVSLKEAKDLVEAATLYPKTLLVNRPVDVLRGIQHEFSEFGAEAQILPNNGERREPASTQ